MRMQITPSYIFMTIFRSKISIHFLSTSKDFPLNSTSIVLILFNSYKQIISYDRVKLKNRRFFCVHMVDFAGQVTFVLN